jgi:hypothetical protein
MLLLLPLLLLLPSTVLDGCWLSLARHRLLVGTSISLPRKRTLPGPFLRGLDMLSCFEK